MSIKKLKEEKSEKTIILVVSNKENRLLYEMYLRAYQDICFQGYPSVEEFMTTVLKENHYSGFIVDLRTMMLEGPDNRSVLHELAGCFPLMRVSQTGGKRHIKGNIKDRNLHDRELFDYFVNDICRHFIPRGIRTKKRRNVFLNVSLDFSSASSGAANASPGKLTRTNTVNVSEEGAYILGTPDIRVGEKFHLVINELKEQSPIECTVKWVLPWGKTISCLPGFGVSFTNIKPEQKEELKALLH